MAVPQFMADQDRRHIHWIEGNPGAPCIAAVAPADRLAVDGEDEVKRMMELEAFQPCPACMADFPWTE